MCGFDFLQGGKDSTSRGQRRKATNFWNFFLAQHFHGCGLNNINGKVDFAASCIVFNPQTQQSAMRILAIVLAGCLADGADLFGS